MKYFIPIFLLLVFIPVTLAAILPEAQEYGYHETLYANQISLADDGALQTRLIVNDPLSLAEPFRAARGGTMYTSFSNPVTIEKFSLGSGYVSFFESYSTRNGVRIGEGSQTPPMNGLYVVGNVVLGEQTPTQPGHATSKFYVDGQLSELNISLRNYVDTQFNYLDNRITNLNTSVNSQFNYLDNRITVVNNSIAGGSNFWSELAGDVYRPTGDVGVGTSDPQAKLDVRGELAVNDNKITGVATPTNPLDAANKQYVDDEIDTLNNSLSAKIGGGGSSLWTERSGTDDIYRMSGNVGLGTPIPQSKLDVQGDARIVGNVDVIPGTEITAQDGGEQQKIIFDSSEQDLVRVHTTDYRGRMEAEVYRICAVHFREEGVVGDPLTGMSSYLPMPAGSGPEACRSMANYEELAPKGLEAHSYALKCIARAINGAPAVQSSGWHLPGSSILPSDIPNNCGWN